MSLLTESDNVPVRKKITVRSVKVDVPEDLYRSKHVDPDTLWSLGGEYDRVNVTGVDREIEVEVDEPPAEF